MRVSEPSTGRIHAFWPASITTGCLRVSAAGQRNSDTWMRNGCSPKSSPSGSSSGRAPAPGGRQGARAAPARRALQGPARRLDAGDAAALGQDAGDLAAGLDRDPETLSGRREAVRGGAGIGVARAGLPGGGADVVGAALGEEGADVLPRDLARLDAEALLAGQVPAQGRLVPGRDQLQEARGLEAALAAHDGLEVPEDLQALQRQARLVLVGVVLAARGAGLAGGPAGRMRALEQAHVPGAHGGGVEAGAGAVGSAADDDDVRS